MNPVYTYSRVGYKFTVYPNRIETEGGNKRETVLLRSVTSAEVKGFTRKLYVTTSDGTTHEFNLGKQAEEARQAIVSLL